MYVNGCLLFCNITEFETLDGFYLMLTSVLMIKNGICAIR